MSPRTINPQAQVLVDRICAAIRELEPTAQVILYGSRARGDAAPDSDWDVLVLLDGPVGQQREETLANRLFELELETDAVISALVYSKENWASPLRRATPLYENVTREGILL